MAENLNGPVKLGENLEQLAPGKGMAIDGKFIRMYTSNGTLFIVRRATNVEVEVKEGGRSYGGYMKDYGIYAGAPDQAAANRFMEVLEQIDIRNEITREEGDLLAALAIEAFQDQSVPRLLNERSTEG